MVEESTSTSATAGPTVSGATSCPMRCVLLAGGLKPTPLEVGAGMPAVRLFPTGEVSVLDNWIARLREISTVGEMGVGRTEVHVVFDHARSAIEAPTMRGGLELIFVRESGAYRGPAGVVHDVTTRFDDEAMVLIAEANRWVETSLAPMLAAHQSNAADVTVGRQADGSPAGVYVAKRSALELINPKGFVDIKEQWLSTCLASGLRVMVHTLEGGGARSMRNRPDVLNIARESAEKQMGTVISARESIFGVSESGSAGQWRAVSSRAEVDPSARVLGSVVMPGAIVGAGAVVARSIVAPGGVVGAGEEIVDQTASGDAEIASRMAARAWETNQ